MKTIMAVYVPGLVLAIVLASCQTARLAPNAAELGVEFSWEGIPRCVRISPEFRLSNIPAGTRHLRFNMVDEQVPTYPHGGSTVAYSGGATVARGAVGYEGPCPPGGAHNYRWEVQALNGEQTLILGVGQATRRFPPQ